MTAGYNRLVINSYHIHDAKTLSNAVPKGVDLIISSPPYFDMKDYGTAGQIGFGQDWDDYLRDMRTVFAECGAVVSETGSMWLVVDTLKRDGFQLLLPFHLVEAAREGGWELKETIIWKKDRTLPFSAKGEMRNIFEYILFFVRNSEFKYYPERVRSFDFKQWWVKYPERYSISGKSPTDVWEFSIPVQGSWGSQYVRHFCPLPEGLVSRIIDLCSDPGDLVLDPFAGSGAVLAAAHRSGRDFIGLDLNPEYKEMFERYLATLGKRERDEESAKTARIVASTIRKLRLLKLPSALLKALRKQAPGVFHTIEAVIVNVLHDPCDEDHTLWRAEYVIHADKSLGEDALEQIEELLGKPPLSKYGIEPWARIEHRSFLESDVYWHYRWDATHLGPCLEAGGMRPRVCATFKFDSDEEELLSRYR